MRMASLISAIPLLRQQIPPILVPKSLKKEYADVQTKVSQTGVFMSTYASETT
jgi:hypothetical protein